MRLATRCRLASVVLTCASVHLAAQSPASATTAIATILVTSQPANTFIPTRTFGAALDGLWRGDMADVYTSWNIAAMRSAGLVPITYRIRTELGIEAWHWNPEGSWSDPGHAQGYWTSAATARAPITVSYGYRLPRRGNTIDQANEDSYSRLDDGDTLTFWKSNPYLDPYFTHEAPDAQGALKHPPWVVVDFGAPAAVNAVRIRWAAPYATRFVVQWWQQAYADDSSTDEVPPDGSWRTFPAGVITHAPDGDMLVRVGKAPVSTRLLRILVLATSHTALPGSRDVRDSLGVAIRELSAGVIGRDGKFRDVIQHARSSHDQTIMYVSSTDPWHREKDRDPFLEQPGFDRVYQSGLTQGRPMMIPVGVLYDTPDNAVAELRYLESRGHPVARVELGEEPDGQGIAPEDFAALYLQFAKAIHGVDPKIALGGPSFQDAIARPSPWRDTMADRSWMRRFLGVLREHQRMRDFAFFSFEWYPYDDICRATVPQLLHEPVKFAAALDTLRGDGVPTNIPWIIAEYGYSAFAGTPEVSMAGALLNADIVGQFLTLGGSAAYLYGYEPTTPMPNERCNSWGDNMLFRIGDDSNPPTPVATYYGARLLTQEWAQPGDGVHAVYRVQMDLSPAARRGSRVTAYAVHRPDMRWSVMLINKDPVHAWSVHLALRHQKDGQTMAFRAISMDQFSPAQYVWHPAGDHGFASPNHPPVHTVIHDAAQVIMLPAYSITVVQGIEGKH